MKQITFTATVEKVANVGGWHYVLIPNDALRELREIAGKNGNIPVLATIGNSTWPTTIMSMGDQRWFVAVKAAVRSAEGVDKGSQATVSLVPDFERLTS